MNISFSHTGKGAKLGAYLHHLIGSASRIKMEKCLNRNRKKIKIKIRDKIQIFICFSKKTSIIGRCIGKFLIMYIFKIFLYNFSLNPFAQ